jgi:hypothetical protein
MTGLEDRMRKDFRVMKDIAVATKHSPKINCGNNTNLMRNLRSQNEILRTDWLTPN